MDGDIPGFVTPVHRALTQPVLMGGAPRSIAIVNGTFAAGHRSAPLGRGSPALVRRPHDRRVGRQARP